jgi:hypothetical protein
MNHDETTLGPDGYKWIETGPDDAVRAADGSVEVWVGGKLLHTFVWVSGEFSLTNAAEGAKGRVLTANGRAL